MEVPEFGEELLETAVKRKGVLKRLQESPAHRQDLQTDLEISKTTCHRIIRTFDEEGFIRRTDAGYELTRLGQVVATAVDQFEEGVKTAYLMRPLLEQFQHAETEFDTSLLTNPDVEWVIARDSSLGLDRGVERVKQTETLRVMDWTPVPELYLERIYRIIAEEGIDAESIYPAERLREGLERFPDLQAAMEESNAEVQRWVYEDVPQWGISIYDESLLELRAYEPETGAYILEAATEHPAVVEWGHNIFEKYRERAEALETRDDLPEMEASSGEE